MPPGHVAEILRAIAAERKLREKTSDRLELVWTGPEVPGSQSRETAIVARELFAKATRSVLVSSCAVFLGKEDFEPLAKRMEELPGLRVLLFLNVPAPPGSDFGHTALVTSAAFTEAAHARNVEAGVVVNDAGFAEALGKQFTSLVAAGMLRRVTVCRVAGESATA